MIDAAPALVRPLELAVGLVFAYAFVRKARRPSRFFATVGEYDVVPRAMVPFVSAAVLVAEPIFAATLIADVAPRLTAIGCSLLLGIFLLALGINLWRGRLVSCGCFGDDSEQISFRSVARVGLLLTATLALALGAELPRSDPGGATVTVATGAFALAALVAGAWLLRLDDLIRVLAVASGQRPSGGSL